MTLLDASSTGLVPLFALPNACLLPGESLPFYVFEPRYRRMLADALEGERLIALARLHPEFENEYNGNPPVHPCMGVGEIAAHRPWPDGSSEIVLRGIARTRLCAVVKPLPYRLGRLVDLPETNSDPERESALRAEIRFCLEPYADEFSRLDCDLERLASAPDLAWRLALLLDLSFEVKQSLLEADDRVLRLDCLLRELARSEQRERMQLLLRQIDRRRVREKGGGASGCLG